MAESQTDFSTKNFSDPHWNSLLDLTGDCLPDLALINQDNKI